MSEYNYAKIFAKRSLICFILIISLLLSAILRVAVVAVDDYGQVASKQAQYRIVISNIRGTIYDCNMVPITNSYSHNFAAISPTPQGIMTVKKYFNNDEKNSVIDTLKNNMPVVCKTENKILSSGIATTLVYDSNSNRLPNCHIIGYIDDSGHGVTGLQKAYDKLLYSDKKVSAVFSSDGKGNILEGIAPVFENDLTVVHSGVITTLDIEIQNIVEKALTDVKSGCAIVAEVGSGKIRALASVPVYDINDISNSLNAENSPMLNRALCNYNVGSVFKPLIAAAAIESGYANHKFNCTGGTQIAGRIFRCHKLEGHGMVDMRAALSNSCNCYFYDVAAMVGGESIYNAASSLSINSRIRIADNIYTTMGILPQKNTLDNAASLANIAIGQGNLIASPVAMLNLYSAIASDGSYFMPRIVEGIIDKSGVHYNELGGKTRVMNESTAKVIREYLKEVVTDGTGVGAASKYCTTAGKTATAQTGRYYEDGTEITNSWFCGFFPSNEPKYVAIVMSDSKQKTTTSAVFAQIVDKIIELDIKNVNNDD